MMDTSEQLPLFEAPTPEVKPAPASPPPLLTPRSPLSRALGEFESYMQRRGFTENTQQAFRLDLQILAEYLTPVKPLGEISPATLNAFLKWMEGPRRVSCSPKTLERRITTLKVFFGWLAEMEYLPKDVAAPLIHHSITAPLADILNDAQLEAALAVTQSLRQGGQNRKPDARPHLLLTLILHTGIKKSECVALQLNHLELDAANPALWVRYKQSNRRHKERRIALPTWWPAVLQEYLDQQQPQQFLFPCTARNLEYVLTDVARQAEILRLTFEMLRWTCAARDFNEGMDREDLRHKLGLSEISWYEVEPKLALLTQRLKA
ncbi:MAG TPA: tyrosine-type recombinase/integrase [Anaerolineae bacterium]|nr:tyrosine-type recombinase/integrase [Anaerolineae bacterium]